MRAQGAELAVRHVLSEKPAPIAAFEQIILTGSGFSAVLEYSCIVTKYVFTAKHRSLRKHPEDAQAQHGTPPGARRSCLSP